MPPPGRTAWPRPRSSPMPLTSPASCSPSSTVRPRAASCSPSPASSASPSSWSAWGRPSTIWSSSTPTSSWRRCSREPFLVPEVRDRMRWLLTRPVVWPLRAGVFGVSAGYRTGRVLGYRRLLLLAAGVGIGLLVAPTPGRELRQKVRERLMGPMGELPAVGDTYDPPLDLTDDALAADEG